MGWNAVISLICALCINHALVVTAQTNRADLEMTHMVINAIHEIIPLDQSNDMFPVINFKNNGPNDIAAATAPAINFVLNAYLSNVNGGPETSVYDLGTIAAESNSVDYLREELPAYIATGFTPRDVDLHIPSSVCDQVEYYCYEVELQASSGLVDPDLSNNFDCEKFDVPVTDDDKIGRFLCYIDIATPTAEVTAPTDLTYLAGTGYTVTFQASIVNEGGIGLESPPAGTHNLKPIVYLTNSAQLETASFKLEQQIQPADTTYDNSVDANETVILALFESVITIPLEYSDCIQATHVCVEIARDRTDYDELRYDNNDFCLEFGQVNDSKAGVKYGCPADGVDLQIQTFDVENWNSVIYNIGRDTDININAVIVNVGDTPIVASTSPNNYEFEVYFINHPSDFDSSTETSSPFAVDYTNTLNLKASLTYGDVLDVTSIGATANIPADNVICDAYQSMCLKVKKGVGAPYTEAITDNNMKCKLLGTDIGNKDCPDLNIDIDAINMTVTPIDGEPYPYLLDTGVPTTIAIGLTNIGTGDLPDASDPDLNFVVEVFLSNSDDLDTATMQEPQITFTVDEAELRQGIDKDEIIGLQLDPAYINIPSDKCYDLLYVCARISLHPSSIYHETNPQSNDFCVEFGPTADGKAGERECYIDIAATGLEVTTPSDLIYDPGVPTAIQVQLTVGNNGGVTLDEMTTMNEDNFNPLIYLTNNANLQSASVAIPTPVTSDGFTQEIPGKATDLVLPLVDVRVTIPTSRAQCESIEFFCLEIFHDEFLYEDEDPSNDFICIEFGPIDEGKAGILNCNISIDLEASNLGVLPEVPKYDFDVDTDATLSVDVTNNGDGSLPSAIGTAVNYDVTVYLTDSENFEDATVMIEQPNLNYDQETLALGIAYGNLIELLTDDALLNIPLDRCLEISHICIVVTLRDSDNSVFVDPDLTNNDACLRFGYVSEGYAGVIPCFIDLAAIRLEVLEPRNLRYLVGIPTTLEVQLTVHNYGALTLDHAPGDTPARQYNFQPQMFVTNNKNLDAATMSVQQPEVETYFEHEVASGVTVILVPFDVSVTIPEDVEDCREISHLCIRIDDNEAVYTDGYPPNDKTCIPFGDIRDGKAGLYTCIGDETEDADDRSGGLPVAYTVGIVTVVIIAVLIGITVAVCNGCKKRNPKYMTSA